MYRTVTQQHISHSTDLGNYPRLLKKKKNPPPPSINFYIHATTQQHRPLVPSAPASHSKAPGSHLSSETDDPAREASCHGAPTDPGSETNCPWGSRGAYSSSLSQPPYQLDVSGRSALRPGLCTSEEEPRYPVNMRVGEPHRRYGYCGEQN